MLNSGVNYIKYKRRNRVGVWLGKMNIWGMDFIRVGLNLMDIKEVIIIEIDEYKMNRGDIRLINIGTIEVYLFNLWGLG